MDDIEKKTLRRKKQNAYEHLDVNSKLLEQFKTLSLIDDEAVESIKVSIHLSTTI